MTSALSTSLVVLSMAPCFSFNPTPIKLLLTCSNDCFADSIWKTLFLVLAGGLAGAWNIVLSNACQNLPLVDDGRLGELCRLDKRVFLRMCKKCPSGMQVSIPEKTVIVARGREAGEGARWRGRVQNEPGVLPGITTHTAHTLRGEWGGGSMQWAGCGTCLRAHTLPANKDGRGDHSAITPDECWQVHFSMESYAPLMNSDA
ncbi:hypothetical protein Taro_006030 [Colocasia esculenta]|uniref:Uncharacterized protein n=1 Tax=Colocasia esculenta TaxID=4460 RepID=A0A843TML4_COLES|nr:hypothetical protein [Colocasia esculenta]